MLSTFQPVMEITSFSTSSSSIMTSRGFWPLGYATWRFGKASACSAMNSFTSGYAFNFHWQTSSRAWPKFAVDTGGAWQQARQSSSKLAARVETAPRRSQVVHAKLSLKPRPRHLLASRSAAAGATSNAKIANARMNASLAEVFLKAR